MGSEFSKKRVPNRRPMPTSSNHVIKKILSFTNMCIKKIINFTNMCIKKIFNFTNMCIKKYLILQICALKNI